MHQGGVVVGTTKGEERHIYHLSTDVKMPLRIAKNILEIHLHELNSHNQTLNKDFPKEFPLRTISILRKSAQEIGKVLNVIRKISSSMEELNPPDPVIVSDTGDISVKEVLADVIKSLKEDACLDHIMLVECIPSDLPNVCVNRTDLEEIFYNLIMNAAQAMLYTGGQLRIDAALQAKPKPAVEISFQDTGGGIPEDAISYIFESPHGDSVTQTGTGTGLNIVKQLVESNAGEISFRSYADVGTTINLFLPVKSGS